MARVRTPPVLEDLVDTCKLSVACDSPHSMILDAMRHLFADPAALASQIPRFTEAEVEPTARGWLVGGEHLLHRDQDLTIMLIDTLPGVVQPPHEHNVDVFIGVFEGCEEQRFWKRTDDGIVSTPGQSLKAGDILSLGVQAVHAISAPRDQHARAVHVYLGDVYDVARSVFHPESLLEHRYTSDRYDEFCRASG